MPPYAFSGFGGGPRTCIGKHLAKLEAKIGLVKFMQRYESMEMLGELKLILKAVHTPKPMKSRMKKYEE